MTNPKPLTIWYAMVKSGLDPDFVTQATQLALKYDGMFQLMLMWYENEDLRERQLTLEAIQDLIEDCK